MYKSVFVRVAFTGLLATMSSSLYAVDGVVLIDQNHALAGNITPGDTPGFPVTISQPGSYKLSSNLTVPDADTTAIQITSNNVTLDLNGFTETIGGLVATSVTTGLTTSTTGVRTGSGGKLILNGDVIFNANRNATGNTGR